jgi:uncharacterized protein YndB with AHSA1/START domain
MQSTDKTMLTVAASVRATPEKTWECWTAPEHIIHWNNASEDWHTPAATNDLQVGGQFTFTMAARDGSMSFDFNGIYDAVVPHEKIAYTMSDGRRAEVLFEADGDTVNITESFEAEDIHAHDMQVAGWQAILNNFKRYVEGA